MDWGAITRIGYGALSLSPQTIGTYTYGEILDMWRGWKYARKLRMQENAQLAAWIMQPHVKKKVSANDLLKTDKVKKTTQEKSDRMVTGMLDRLGGGTLWQQ